MHVQVLKTTLSFKLKPRAVARGDAGVTFPLFTDLVGKILHQSVK